MLSRLPIILLIAVPLTLSAVADCDGDGFPTPVPETPTPIPSSQCIITGCSGQICAADQVDTTCEWVCEYGCFQYATCGVSADGDCGWSTTPDYDACIAQCASTGS